MLFFCALWVMWSCLVFLGVASSLCVCLNTLFVCLGDVFVAFFLISGVLCPCSKQFFGALAFSF